MPEILVPLIVDSNKIDAVAEQLLNMEHITAVYTLEGHYDLLAVLRLNSEEAETAINRLAAVAGISKAKPLACPSIPDMLWRTCLPSVWKTEHEIWQDDRVGV